MGKENKGRNLVSSYPFSCYLNLPASTLNLLLFSQTNFILEMEFAMENLVLSTIHPQFATKCSKLQFYKSMSCNMFKLSTYPSSQMVHGSQVQTKTNLSKVS